MDLDIFDSRLMRGVFEFETISAVPGSPSGGFPVSEEQYHGSAFIKLIVADAIGERCAGNVQIGIAGRRTINTLYAGNFDFHCSFWQRGLLPWVRNISLAIMNLEAYEWLYKPLPRALSWPRKR